MRLAAKCLSLAALVAIPASALAYFARAIELDRMILLTNLATLAWFIATPFWMGRAEPSPTPTPNTPPEPAS